MRALVVIYGQPRTGSHVLRSVLEADPMFHSIWAFTQPSEAGESFYDSPEAQPDRHATLERVKAFLTRVLEEHPGQIVLAHIKEGAWPYNDRPPLQAAVELGAAVVHLVRKDRFAQAASLALAMKTGQFVGPLPAGHREKVEVPAVAFKRVLSRLNEPTAADLLPADTLTLDFDDLVTADETRIRQTALQAMSQLIGHQIAAGEAKVLKSSRPEAYIENFGELVSGFADS